MFWASSSIVCAERCERQTSFWGCLMLPVARQTESSTGSPFQNNITTGHPTFSTCREIQSKGTWSNFRGVWNESSCQIFMRTCHKWCWCCSRACRAPKAMQLPLSQDRQKWCPPQQDLQLGFTPWGSSQGCQRERAGRNEITLLGCTVLAMGRDCQQPRQWWSLYLGLFPHQCPGSISASGTDGLWPAASLAWLFQLHHCKTARGQLPWTGSHGWEAWEISRRNSIWGDFRASWENLELKRSRVTPETMEWTRRGKSISDLWENQGHPAWNLFIWSPPLTHSLGALWAFSEKQNMAWGPKSCISKKPSPRPLSEQSSLEHHNFQESYKKFSQKIKSSALI